MKFFRSPVLSLARRFLLSKSSDGFLSFIAGVSIVGVCLGVMALTVVTSVINGFEGELVRVITGMNGDVILYSRGEPVRDLKFIEERIRETVPQTQFVTASFISELMVSGAGGVSGAVLQGIELDRIGQVTQIPRRVISGRLPERDGEVALGSALAEKLGATALDSEVRVIAPFTGKGTESKPKALNVKVVGIVRMGMYDYDSKFLFMTLESVQRFFEQPHRATSFNIKLAPGTSSRRASDELSSAFEYPFRAKDWGQLNKNLFYAIKLEKIVIAIILTVIVIVAAFNVVSTLMMMIHDKTKEIAILKAMGLRPSQSFQLFCVIGLGIGAVGTLMGVIGGLGLGWMIERTHWIQLPEDIYYIGFLPVVVRWNEIGWIVAVAMAISLFATFYPSWSVSRRPPLEGLRYE